MENGKKRKWFCTINNWTEKDYMECEKLMEKTLYGILCKEIGKKCGVPHLHLWLHFKNGREFKTIQNKLKRANIQPGKGTDIQVRKYLTKEENFIENGNPIEEKEQGQRTDLEDLKDDIMNGKKVDDIVVETPHLYHQYGRTLEKLETIRNRKKFRTWMTKGYWVWGPGGVGKSHRAFKNFNPDTHYRKPLNEKYWNGYTGQEIVILNEFKGQIFFGELMELVDKWPHTVVVKNGEAMPFLAKEVWITCSKNPYSLYECLGDDENENQFERRFRTIYKKELRCTKGNNKPLCLKNYKTWLHL